MHSRNSLAPLEKRTRFEHGPLALRLFAYAVIEKIRSYFAATQKNGQQAHTSNTGRLLYRTKTRYDRFLVFLPSSFKKHITTNSQTHTDTQNEPRSITKTTKQDGTLHERKSESSEDYTRTTRKRMGPQARAEAETFRTRRKEEHGAGPKLVDRLIVTCQLGTYVVVGVIFVCRHVSHVQLGVPEKVTRPEPMEQSRNNHLLSVQTVLQHKCFRTGVFEDQFVSPLRRRCPPPPFT